MLLLVFRSFFLFLERTSITNIKCGLNHERKDLTWFDDYWNSSLVSPSLLIPPPPLLLLLLIILGLGHDHIIDKVHRHGQRGLQLQAGDVVVAALQYAPAPAVQKVVLITTKSLLGYRLVLKYGPVRVRILPSFQPESRIISKSNEDDNTTRKTILKTSYFSRRRWLTIKVGISLNESP